MRSLFLLLPLAAGVAHAGVPTVPPPVFDGTYAPCGEGVPASQIFDVPAEFGTISDAVAVAPPGSIIRLAPRPHMLASSIPITKNLTICGTYAPRGIYDGPAEDIEDDVQLFLESSVPFNVADFKGAFVIRNGAKLTFQNIRFKMPELACGDRLDNDGNGLTDERDPACVFAIGSDTDTAIDVPTTFFDSPEAEFRAFFVEQDGTLELLNSEFQGWSFAIEGNVVAALSPAAITIRNSNFIHNHGQLGILPNGDYVRSRGIVYTRGGVITIQNSMFWRGTQRYGGALYATDGALVSVTDSTFTLNYAEEGGSIWVEASTLDLQRNVFAQNNANRVPTSPISGVIYKGGALFTEDSVVNVSNNIFLGNSSLAWAGAMYIRRSFTPAQIPRVVNNTFVFNVPNLEGGASVVFDETRFDYINNISFQEYNGAVGAQNWIQGSVPNVKYNDFFGIPDTNVLVADLSGLPVDRSTNIFDDPLFVYFQPQVHNDWRLWRFWLKQISPAIDAGDPSIFDVGGTRSDIGAYGGALAGAVDQDGDGWTDLYDCDDNDPAIRPYALELCDDIDNDCNGIIDDRERTYYLDVDLDGWGAGPANGGPPTVSVCQGESPPIPTAGVYVLQGGDCDEASTITNPGRPEFCDGEDNDCNGLPDDGIPIRTHYLDVDGDGFGTPNRPGAVVVTDCPDPGYSPFNTDCNDLDPDIHPLIDVVARTHLPLANAPVERHEADRNPAFVGDGIDQDCDTSDLCFPDADDDGYGAKAAPGAEPRYVVDSPNDLSCANLSAQTSPTGTDCDDSDPAVFPGAQDFAADNIDGDCDGVEVCYRDEDGDGFGLEGATVEDNNTDCDDDSAPTAGERKIAGVVVFDCDDTRAEIYPGAAAEICDGFDNDCDGTIDEVTSPSAADFYRDQDGDGWGDIGEFIKACGTPVGYAAQPGDCDDLDPRAFPGNTETCDGVDNNCEAGIDESTATDVKRYYEDLDGDGWPNRDLYQDACEQPDGGKWVEAGTRPDFDCDDNTSEVGPCCTCSQANPRGGMMTFFFGVLLVGLRRRRLTA
ncbi:MAG: hypothetical protein H6732_04815 [Alphaproteobacteria bacterium]|nr:hypothetical protein [Alphaproteobacteria bacterium]